MHINCRQGAERLSIIESFVGRLFQEQHNAFGAGTPSVLSVENSAAEWCFAGSGIGAKSPVVSCVALRAVPHDPARGWVHFLSTGGGRFAIAVDGEPHLHKYLRLILWAQELKNIVGEESFTHVSCVAPDAENFRDPVASVLEYAFCVKMGDGTSQRAYVALDREAPIASSIKAVDTIETRTLRLRLFLKLNPNAFEEIRRSRNTSIAISELQFWLGETRRGGAFSLCNFNDERWELRMQDEKSEVNEKGGTFSVHIELGTIELTAGALLNLRPGDVISVDALRGVNAVLTVSGQPWAEVKAERERDALVLTVEGLLGFDETISPVPRLDS